MKIVPRLSGKLLVVEALFCFALPLYFLFWGVISAPLWVGGLGTSATYLWWYLFDVVGGLLGLIGVVSLLRWRTKKHFNRDFPAIRTGLLMFAGVLAVWDAPSNHFSEFSLDFFTFLMAVLPTLCALHLYLLALLRSRHQGFTAEPNKTMEPTR